MKINLLVLAKNKLDLNNFILKHKNSLINFKNGLFYFKSKYKTIEEIILFEVYDVSYNIKYFLKFITKIVIPLSFEEAKKICYDEIYEKDFQYVYKDKKWEDLIEQILLKYSYSDFKEHGIFDLATDIFIAFLKGHLLENGNKRFSISFLRVFLRRCGYYFFGVKIW